MTTDLTIPAHLQSITTLADTAYGRMLVLIDDIPRGRSLLTTGKAPDHEEIRDLCIRLHARGPEVVAIDCGANMGTHTLAFAQYCAVVHAFEPQAVLYEILSYNVAHNHAAVAVYPFAVGATGGNVWMPAIDYAVPGDFGMVQCGTVERPQARDAQEWLRHGTDQSRLRYRIALDAMLGHLSRVDLLKIDVEGMESDVLAGAAGLIRRLHPILFVEWFRSDRRALEGELRALGYADIRMVGINLLAVP